MWTIARGLIEEYADALEKVIALIEVRLFGFSAALGGVLEDGFSELVVGALLLLHAVVEYALLLHLLHVGRDLVQMLFELEEVGESLGMGFEVLLEDLKCKLALKAETFGEG